MEWLLRKNKSLPRDYYLQPRTTSSCQWGEDEMLRKILLNIRVTIIINYDEIENVRVWNQNNCLQN